MKTKQEIKKILEEEEKEAFGDTLADMGKINEWVLFLTILMSGIAIGISFANILMIVTGKK